MATASLLVTENAPRTTFQTPAEVPQDWVVVGKISRPWGIKGDVIIESHTDSPGRFSPGSILYVNGHVATVIHSRKSRGMMIVKLDLIEDRNHSESLRGALLTIPTTELKPLPLNAFYHFDIIDCGVWTEAREYLGSVKEILQTGANDVYVIRANNKEILIPAISSVVMTISPKNRTIVVRLPTNRA